VGAFLSAFKYRIRRDHVVDQSDAESFGGPDLFGEEDHLLRLRRPGSLG